MKSIKFQWFYLLKWTNYGSGENSWVRENYLACDDLLQNFERGRITKVTSIFFIRFVAFVAFVEHD